MSGATIWKYPLQITDGPQGVTMPDESCVIHCAGQHGALTLWAIVKPGAPGVLRYFRVYGTGHPGVPTGHVTYNEDCYRENPVLGSDYVGTVQMGSLVWHVFEVSP